MKENTAPDAKKHLRPFREKIDKIDDALIRLLGERYAVVREVAKYKIRHDVKIVQSDRVHEVKERNAKTASRHGVNPDLVRTLYALIIDEAHVIEHAMKKNVNGGFKKASQKPGRRHAVPAPVSQAARAQRRPRK
jgi:chorismate mutase-like protein